MKKYLSVFFAILSLFFILMITVAKAEKPSVDVAIILATDVSGSVSIPSYNLQVEGIAQAFESEEIKRAIRNGYYKKIAVMYVQWSSINQQWISEWFIISSDQEADDFAKYVRSIERKFSWDTSVLGLLTKSLEIMGNLPFEADKKVIDISGDGKDTGLTAVQGIHSIRVILKSMGVQINALPIIDAEADVGTWYEQNVIYGPGSFAVIIQDFNDFAKAIRRKLLTEIGSINESNILQ